MKIDMDYSIQNRINIFNKFLSHLKGKNVIDFGPGNGIYSKKLLENGCNVCAIGMDYNNNIKQLEKQYNNFQFVELNLDNIGDSLLTLSNVYGVSNDKLDGIWLSHCLEHLYNPINFLCICNDLLNKNGILCVIVPPFKHEIVDCHIFTGWNIGSLMSLLARCGFNIKSGKYKTCGYNIAAIVNKGFIENFKFVPGSERWFVKNCDIFPDKIKDEILKNKRKDNCKELYSYFNGNIKELNW